jgi:integrase/recombinase XerC/integrase/recombinase XerD
LFNWTEASGIYPNVASRLKSQKRQHGFLRDALSKNQVIQLLAAIDTSTIQGKRNLALINLLVRTGLRTIEASRLLVSDIKQKSGTTILLVQGKGQTSKTDFVILYPSTLKPIQDYLHARGDVQTDAPLFVSHSDRNSGSKLATRTIRNIVKDHLRAIGIDDKRVSAHSLRHSCFSLAAEAGCSILEVQQLARHRSITTSAIYVHTTERLKNNAESRIEEFLSDEAVASPEISNNGNGNGGDKNSE